MTALSWLTARPIAHRGLHDARAGVIENTPTAIDRAAARGFGCEIDVHLSADGRVYAFHDDSLERLTEAHGDTAALTLAALKAVPFKATADRIPSLEEVLEIVAGRGTLVVEIKSRFGPAAPDALVDAVAAILASYSGPVAVKSFDPRVVARFADVAPGLARGIVADDAADAKDYGGLDGATRADLAALGHVERSRPQFLSYWVKLLPNAVSRRARNDWGLPLITWTVRSPEDRAIAADHADQIVFEGFDPDAD